MGGGGHSSTTTHVSNNSRENVNVHNKNELNSKTNFDITRTDSTTVNGNISDGRSVVMQDTANTGLQCFGMMPNDPRCHKLMVLLL